jgi:hypothetical protein
VGQAAGDEEEPGHSIRANESRWNEAEEPERQRWENGRTGK